jgi:hypothetical protein
MLLAMTAAAATCWWFLRPQMRDEELAGTHLKLRRDVRLAEVEAIPQGQSSPGLGSPGQGEPQQQEWTSVGSWEVFGKRGERLVAGRYREGEPHGTWTLWHINGRRAAEGRMWRGARTGVWRTWDEGGQLRSEVEYRVRESLAAFNGIGASGIAWLPDYFAERHGSVRVWHANGALACEGQYRDDRRDGPWTWYDEQGRVIEQGAYRADVREGNWTSGSTTLRYTAGQRQEIHDEQLAALAEDLGSRCIRRQIAAAAQLENLGQAGVPHLARAAARGNGTARLVALRALVRQDAVPREMLPAIEPLVEHADRRLALWAMLAVYQREPGRRGELVGSILAAARQSPSNESLAQAAKIVYQVDAPRRPLVVGTIVEAFAPRREMSQGYLEQEPPDEALVAMVARLGDDVLGHVAAAFDSPRPEVRHFVIATIDRLVRRGEGRRVTLPGNRSEVRWPISDHIQQVITRAKTDPDPAVRQAAEWVGRQPEYGAGCFFGSVGFSGSPPF